MQEQNRRPNAQRSEETRAALLKAARKLFVAKGFADTGTPEIVAAASITRGALYHHFKDKQELFHAVLLVEADAVARSIAGVPPGDPATALLHGARAYFKAMARPGRARLLLIEGPAVLDHDTMAKISESTGSAELRAGLAALAKIADPFPVDAMTDLMSAMFDQAALQIARGANPAPYMDAVNRLIYGLTV